GWGGGRPPARRPPPSDPPEARVGGRARPPADAPPPAAPGRGPRRKELITAYLGKIEHARDSRDDQFRRFRELISLWRAEELTDAQKAAADLDLVAPQAERIFKEASTTGLDVQAVTALAVLVSAQPDKREQHEKTWKDILAYTNALAIAEAGPGAERSRAIEALENATQAFPSRWAGDKLIELYLARQAAIMKAISSGTKSNVVGAHKDPGVMRPVWNLTRAYARGHRLADAPDAADKLSGPLRDAPA